MFDYIFACRPSTICNMNCSYCYRHDDISDHHKTNEFDIDSMLWHSEQFPNNVFNFCGYGETMMHPQFAEIINSLTQVTHVNWVTNGTMLNKKVFDDIREHSNFNNITEITISVHFGHIPDYDKYFTAMNDALEFLLSKNVYINMTAVVTDDNVNEIVTHKHYVDRYKILLKPEFEYYKLNGDVKYNPVSNKIRNAFRFNGLKLEQDAQPVVTYPYFGKRCPNGYRTFEVMHDGVIYDCSFDENRVEIGNINIKTPIKQLDSSRTCKTKCETCVPMLRGGYLFNLGKPSNENEKKL